MRLQHLLGQAFLLVIQPHRWRGRKATTVGSRKRALRKCRHSKIVTANGPRDRRMRLSIDVARSFFRLQDTLGFDKASKTVQWLLTVSKAAIEELGTLSSAEHSGCSNRSPKSESSALVCQDSSAISSSKNQVLHRDRCSQGSKEEQSQKRRC
ncbi:unnamed protein product [Musa acuminata var. zebrina]